MNLSLAYHNGFQGIDVDTSQHIFVTANDARFNGDGGIGVTNLCARSSSFPSSTTADVYVEANIASGNCNFGLGADGANDIHITGNQLAADNGGGCGIPGVDHGIFLSRVDDFVVTGNVGIYGNGEYGIAIWCSQDGDQELDVYDNDVGQNGSYARYWDGRGAFQWEPVPHICYHCNDPCSGSQGG